MKKIYKSAKYILIPKVINLNGLRLQILKADEFTMNYMNERPNVFPQCDPTYVFDRIRQCKILII